MAAWTGTLHFRHRKLLRHRADLWQPDLPLPPGGKPEDTTYSLALAAVPCLRDTKSAIDSPDGVLAVIEADDMLTVDTWRFPVGVDLGSSWVIVDRSGGLNDGRAWICKGEPVREEDADTVRTSGMTEAYATRMVRPPAAVREHYS